MLKLVFWTLLLINGALFAYREGYLDAVMPSGREPARLAQQLNADKIRLLPANPKPANQPSSAAPAAPAEQSAADPGADKAGKAEVSPAVAVTESVGLITVADAKADPAKPMPAEPDKKPGTDKPAEANGKAEADKQADANKKAEVDKTPEAAKPLEVAAKTDKADKKADTLACTEFGNFNEVDAGRFEARLAGLTAAANLSRRVIREPSGHMVFIPPQGSKEGADRKVEQLRGLGVTDFYVVQDQSEMRWGISLGVFSSEDAARKRLEQLKQQGVRSARTGARSTINKVAVQIRALDAASRDKLEKIKTDFPQQQQRNCA